MLREELKSKDLRIKKVKILSSILQTIKEIKAKPILVEPISSYSSASEANLIPANNSVAIEDVNSNNGEIADTKDEVHIPDKININDNDAFKKSMQRDEVIKEKKEKYYEFKISVNKSNDPVATNNNTETGEAQGDYPDGTSAIIGDFILRKIEQERTGC